MRKVKKLLRQTFKLTGADKIMYAYAGYFLAVAILLLQIEPNIKTLQDSLWYCFAVATTVGFGDITAISTGGRVLSAILSVYSIGVVAIFTAVITSLFMDIGKARASDSAKEFLDDLEHLPDMSREELQELSGRARKFIIKDEEELFP